MPIMNNHDMTGKDSCAGCKGSRNRSAVEGKHRGNGRSQVRQRRSHWQARWVRNDPKGGSKQNRWTGRWTRINTGATTSFFCFCFCFCLCLWILLMKSFLTRFSSHKIMFYGFSFTSPIFFLFIAFLCLLWSDECSPIMILFPQLLTFSFNLTE